MMVWSRGATLKAMRRLDVLKVRPIGCPSRYSVAYEREEEESGV